MDLSSWISFWATWSPSRVALRFEGADISYAELAARIIARASELLVAGVSEGERVAYLGPNRPELLELLFACSRIGAIFVPLNARMPPAELRVFAGQSEPRLLFADEGFLEAARASIEPGCGVRTLSNPVLQASVESPLARATDRAAVIAYTSGTTGTPKGVVLTNGALLANAMNARAVFALSAGDHVLMALGRSFRTGDAGYIDEDGFLHIVERLKDIIIVGGSNVYPADIESVLVSDPRVREAAVVGRPDTECGEVPAAFVVGEPGLTHDHVRALFHGVLAEYKHPRDVFFVEQLPRSALGKVQRSVLRAWAQSERSGVARRDSSEPAATAQLV